MIIMRRATFSFSSFSFGLFLRPFLRALSSGISGYSSSDFFTFLFFLLAFSTSLSSGYSSSGYSFKIRARITVECQSVVGLRDAGRPLSEDMVTTLDASSRDPDRDLGQLLLELDFFSLSSGSSHRPPVSSTPLMQSLALGGTVPRSRGLLQDSGFVTNGCHGSADTEPRIF